MPVLQAATQEAGKRMIRRGVVYMFLAAVAYYFAAVRGGKAVPGVLTDYLLPFLFLAGLALALFGAYRRLSA